MTAARDQFTRTLGDGRGPGESLAARAGHLHVRDESGRRLRACYLPPGAPNPNRRFVHSPKSPRVAFYDERWENFVVWVDFASRVLDNRRSWYHLTERPGHQPRYRISGEHLDRLRRWVAAVSD